MRIRIVVADQAEARFYDAEPPEAALHASGSLRDPTARLHERDLVSDRPGRVFERASIPGSRRGASAHHDTGGERSARKSAAVAFARRIATELERGQQQRRFDGIVLMANPRFLGLLRQVFSPRLGRCVVAEVPKDLVHQSERVVSAHLPRQALR